MRPLVLRPVSPSCQVVRRHAPRRARVQIAINFPDMRGTRRDLPGVVSRTTHPQSAFPRNDLLSPLLREHDAPHLRLINGSGTRRLGAPGSASCSGMARPSCTDGAPPPLRLFPEHPPLRVSGGRRRRSRQAHGIRAARRMRACVAGRTGYLSA